MAKTIHVVSILDRSGSMMGSQQEVIGAYNAFIEDQKKIASDKGVKIKTSLYLFDDRYEEVYAKVPVAQTPELNEETYTIRGMTALYDAVGKTINKFQDKKNVIMFIETDGYENSSQEFDQDSLQALVKEKTKGGWDFNFVGADLSKATTTQLGTRMGIDASKTMHFAKSAEGYATRNATFTASTMAYVDSKS